MSDTTQRPTKPLLSDVMYERLRVLTQYIFPGLGAAYFALADIWGLPKAQEVVGTIVVIDTFLGILLGRAKSSYDKSDEKFDGSITVTPGEEEHTSEVRVQVDPRALAGKNEVLVKVNKPV